MARRIPRFLRVEFFLGLGFLGLTIYAVLVEPFWLSVETPVVLAPRLSANLATQKIAFVSDLYIKAKGHRERSLLQKIQKSDSEILLISGGLELPEEVESLETLLSLIAQNRASFAVLGQDEEASEELLSLLQTAGVVLLKDSQAEFLGQNGPIDIIGVHWPIATRRLLETRDTSRPAILLLPSFDTLHSLTDALLLEAPRNKNDSSVEWRESRGTWRFSQENTILLEKGGPHRVRVQRAMADVIIDEIHFLPKKGKAIVLSGDSLAPYSLKGGIRLVPGSSYGSEGNLIYVGGAKEMQRSPLLSPKDYFETSLELPKGIYQVTAKLRSAVAGQGAVWIQVEGASSKEGKSRYRLGEEITFPQEEDRIDLILAGGTLGGKIPSLVWLGRLLWPKEYSEKYYNYLSGLYNWNKIPLYVTRGLGTKGVPMRFFAPPELTLLEIQ